MEDINYKKLHIAMYPWFAYSHINQYLHLANKLAKKGNKISLIVPKKTSSKLAPNNNYPNLITFIPITLPAIDGLPAEAETTADGPNFFPLLMTAMDMTQPIINSLLCEIRSNFIFFDYPTWLPYLAKKNGVKSIFYSTVHMPFLTYHWPYVRPSFDEIELRRPPPGYPSSSDKFRLQAHEARGLAFAKRLVSTVDGVSFPDKVWLGIQESDGFCCKGCKEMEGPFCDYFENHLCKKVLWAGPGLPNLPVSCELDTKIDKWMKRFPKGSVLYCSLGSERVLQKYLFQELLLGLELTGLPFIVAVKPPEDYETMDSALPQGFKERTREQGLIQDGWIQQELILKHPSVGCFITHCGAGSFTEALVSECQLVLLPLVADQCINARLMSLELRVAVEIEKSEEDGSFTKEEIFKAIMEVMNPTSEIGIEVMRNHAKWRDLLLEEGFEDSYIGELLQSLQNLLLSVN